MKMSECLYDALKAIAQYILPGIGTLYFALAEIWGWPCSKEIVGTINAIDALLGVILKISSDQYYEELEAEENNPYDEPCF